MKRIHKISMGLLSAFVLGACSDNEVTFSNSRQEVKSQQIIEEQEAAEKAAQEALANQIISFEFPGLRLFSQGEEFSVNELGNDAIDSQKTPFQELKSPIFEVYSTSDNPQINVQFDLSHFGLRATEEFGLIVIANRENSPEVGYPLSATSLTRSQSKLDGTIKNNRATFIIREKIARIALYIKVKLLVSQESLVTADKLYVQSSDFLLLAAKENEAFELDNFYVKLNNEKLGDAPLKSGESQAYLVSEMHPLLKTGKNSLRLSVQNSDIDIEKARSQIILADFEHFFHSSLSTHKKTNDNGYQLHSWTTPFSGNQLESLNGQTVQTGGGHNLFYSPSY